MKLEFDPNGKYMQEGYWGIHTPEDECAYTRLEKPAPYGMIGVIRQLWTERESRES